MVTYSRFLKMNSEFILLIIFFLKHEHLQTEDLLIKNGAILYKHDSL